LDQIHPRLVGDRLNHRIRTFIDGIEVVRGQGILPGVVVHTGEHQAHLILVIG
jgi:hypothetical protein